MIGSRNPRKALAVMAAAPSLGGTSGRAEFVGQHLRLSGA